MRPSPRGLVRRALGAEGRGLAGDSLYVGIWQGSVSVADLVQIALVTHALGLSEYGRFALVVAFATLVSQFFDVRVGTAATIFGARGLRRDARSAAGVFQVSYLIDAATGVLGLVFVAAAAPFVGPSLIDDNGALLLLLYALALFGATLNDSSLAVLRLLDRFKTIAAYTVALEALRVGLLVAALAIDTSLVAVFIALLVYNWATGLVNLTAAVIAFRRSADGARLTRPSLDLVRSEAREMLRMVLHTNVVSYARLAQTQLPAIVIGAVSTTTQVGAYKLGMAAAAMVRRLADPAYVAVLPRFSRLWSAGQLHELRRLVERVCYFSVPAMVFAVLAVVLLREPILEVLGGESGAAEAGTVLILGALAQGVNGAVFWNVGVLFVAGGSRAVAVIASIGAAAQIALLVPLTLASDATGAATAFLLSMVVTNAVTTGLAVRALRSKGDRPQHELDTEAAVGASAADAYG